MTCILLMFFFAVSLWVLWRKTCLTTEGLEIQHAHYPLRKDKLLWIPSDYFEHLHQVLHQSNQRASIGMAECDSHRLVSISDKTSFCKISCVSSVEAARLVVNQGIALTFNSRIGSTAAEATVKYQSDCAFLNTSFAAPNLCKTLQLDFSSYIVPGPWLAFATN